MLTERLFPTFTAFAAFMAERALLYIPTKAVGLAAVAEVLERKTRSMFGSKVLADLAPSTKRQRLQLGFTPNDPLKRDGSLLRDSVQKRVGPDFAAVGSSEPVMFYHEYGYYNVRAKKRVPPRPVFRIALEESAVPIVRILEDMTGLVLGFSTTTSSAPFDLQTRANSYISEVEIES